MSRFNERLKREEEALRRHRYLSRLFRENRFEFERERKRMIKEVIDGADNDELRERLIQLQSRWDSRMKEAGSPHNRFVLAKTFFWEHFFEVWYPEITRLNRLLNGPPDVNQRSGDDESHGK